ncbi:S2545-like protein, partial [Mya arenaria]
FCWCVVWPPIRHCQVSAAGPASREPARGFFRGLSWPLFSYGLVNSVFFGTYASTLKVLGSHTGHSKAPEFLPILVAGSVGGVAQLSVSVPIEVIKVVLQSQIPHPDKQHKVSVTKHLLLALAIFQTVLYLSFKPGINRDYYKGPREGALDIIRSQGVRGMYRGTITQMYRDVPASASYFLVFEYCSYYSHKHLSFLNSQLIDFVSGGLAGVLSWTLITPLDVLKSRVQADVKGNMYSGLWDCAGKSIKQEGIRVLFRGYSAVATRAFLVNSVTLLVYVELLKAFKVNERATTPTLELLRGPRPPLHP